MLAEIMGGMLESAEDNYQNLRQSKGRPDVIEGGLIEHLAAGDDEDDFYNRLRCQRLTLNP